MGGRRELMPGAIGDEEEGERAAETGLVGSEVEGAGVFDWLARSLLTCALCTGVCGDLTPCGYILLSWKAWQYRIAVV